MRRARWFVPLQAAMCLTALASTGCDAPFPNRDELEQLKGLPRLATAPADSTNRYLDQSPALEQLGAKLFDEKALSGCGTVACSSCHPSPYYAESKPLSDGCNGKKPGRHTPTLLNVAFNRWFMWDGRVDSLWAQASLPLYSANEMASPVDGSAVRSVLGGAGYRDLYQTAFGADPTTEPDVSRLSANLGKALEAHERTFISTEKEFDRQVQSFLAAVAAGTEPQHPFYLALKTYFRRGQCILCHDGPNLTDGKFHNLGLDLHGVEDHGRSNGIPQLLANPLNGASSYSDDPVGGQQKLDAIERDQPDDEGAIKTASLRDVANTAPYMHNGSMEKLEDVIDFYDRGGDDGGFVGHKTVSMKPLGLSKEEKDALMKLLQSL